MRSIPRPVVPLLLGLLALASWSSASANAPPLPRHVHDAAEMDVAAVPPLTLCPPRRAPPQRAGGGGPLVVGAVLALLGLRRVRRARAVSQRASRPPRVAHPPHPDRQPRTPP